MEEFFRKLAYEGGKIVSAQSLSTKEVKLASNQGRMFVDSIGIEYVWLPENK